MHAVSQIIEKNLHPGEIHRSCLWINPEKDDSWIKAATNCVSLKLFSQDYGCFSFLQRSGAEVEFSAFPQASVDKYSWIIVNLPRQKALLGMLLECAVGLLAEDGILWLAGENRAGIKSADKLLKLHFAQVRKLDNARHCTLYEASKRLNQQVFDPLSYRLEWTLNYKHKEIEVISYPGVFAHGRLDAGTALLLDALAKMEIEGDVLDFACGAGVIGACIASNRPQARVTLLDTSALALRASEETLEANQLNGSVLASDGLLELEDQFDLIVSNPPIHAGVKTDTRLSMRLLESVPENIKPGGSLIIVANVHLPYENWLTQRFRHYEQCGSNNDYKIIMATK